MSIEKAEWGCFHLFGCSALAGEFAVSPIHGTNCYRHNKPRRLHNVGACRWTVGIGPWPIRKLG